jgi:hypothetical protein
MRVNTKRGATPHVQKKGAASKRARPLLFNTGWLSRKKLDQPIQDQSISNDDMTRSNDDYYIPSGEPNMTPKQQRPTSQAPACDFISGPPLSTRSRPSSPAAGR